MIVVIIVYESPDDYSDSDDSCDSELDYDTYYPDHQENIYTKCLYIVPIPFNDGNILEAE